jgi:predicted nucleic acid-binding protein
MKRCIVDTGALVSLLDRSDVHHSWAVDAYKQLKPPLLTCEAVFAETLHLLADLPPSPAALARLYNDGILRIDFAFRDHAQSVWDLLEKYRDLPMDFADACLVRMTELHDDCAVWTTDGHFRFYRRHGRKSIPFLMP